MSIDSYWAEFNVGAAVETEVEVGVGPDVEVGVWLDAEGQG